jgi:small-conductance mechanosensitive channel
MFLLQAQLPLIPQADSLLRREAPAVVVDWLMVGLTVGICLLIGLLIEQFLFSRLRKLAERTDWRGDDIILSALRGVTSFIFLLIGLFFASYSLPVSHELLVLFHRVIQVLFIVACTMILSRIAVGFVTLPTSKEDNQLPSASILTYIARASVYLIGFLVILQSLDISITPLLTALGVGGLAVALALQDTLSNLFAGIHILASRKIRTGDFIRLETGQEGTVTDISWRTTSIKGAANHLIIVPNTRVASSIVVDFDQPEREVVLVVPLAVGYDSDLDKVERITIEVAKAVLKEVAGGVTSSEPVVRFAELGDSSIRFNLIVRVRQFDEQFLIRHELIKRLLARYAVEKISIPYPVRNVNLKGDGHQSHTR